MLCIFDWKNQRRANRCCINVRIFGQLLCSHSTIHSLLNCLRIRRKRENHSSDRLELDLTFGKTLKESSLSSILDVRCWQNCFFLNYGLQHGTLFQVHKLCHISCFFTCYVLSMGKRTNAQIDTPHLTNMDSTMAQDPHVQVVDSNNRDGGWDTDRQLCRSPIVSCALPLGGETPTSLP